MYIIIIIITIIIIYRLYVGYLQLYTWNIGYIVLQLFCSYNFWHM